ncbi:response regulator [Alkaliphilus transvaalensis]|uniref:response regulator n=1 Tax=Alkaliphilus transvaalensis TaxID=114628 RepID=UPI00047C3658|nr:response regulator transcription factor [Alkaliphilus transvaalensis]
MDKIRVMIVDDHEMVRMGLSAYLSTEDHLEIVGEASNGLEALKLSEVLLPDVILMDLMMDQMDGIEATEKILKRFNEINKTVKIIVLTSFIDDEKVFAALEAGAFSFLLKTATANELSIAIKKAVKDEPVFEGKVTNLMISRVNKKTKHTQLTQRELEVLQLIGQGKSNKEISEELFIGIKTVKTHVSNILAKLELEDRTKAAVYANQNNLL